MSERGTMEARLILVGGRATKKEIRLRLPVRVGRSPKADVTILHPLVSRRHCEIFERDGELVVRDTGSANGTYIEGERIDEAVLRPGSRLTIGPLTFEAVCDTADAEAVRSNGSAGLVADEAASDEITLDEPLELAAAGAMDSETQPGEVEAPAPPATELEANDQQEGDFLPLDALDVDEAPGIEPDQPAVATAEPATTPTTEASASPADAPATGDENALDESIEALPLDGEAESDMGDFDFLEVEDTTEPQTEQTQGAGSNDGPLGNSASVEADKSPDSSTDEALSSQIQPSEKMEDDIDLDALATLDDDLDELADFDLDDASDDVAAAEATPNSLTSSTASTDNVSDAPAEEILEPDDLPDPEDDLDATLNLDDALDLEVAESGTASSTASSTTEPAQTSSGEPTQSANDLPLPEPGNTTDGNSVGESIATKEAGDEEVLDALADFESVDDTELAVLEDDEELGLLFEDQATTPPTDTPSAQSGLPETGPPEATIDEQPKDESFATEALADEDEAEVELMPLDADDALGDLDDLDLPALDDEPIEADDLLAADDEAAEAADSSRSSPPVLPDGGVDKTEPNAAAAKSDETAPLEAALDEELDALDVEEFEELDDTALMSLEEDESLELQHVDSSADSSESGEERLQTDAPDQQPAASAGDQAAQADAVPDDAFAEADVAQELETAEISEDDIFEFLSEGESSEPASKSKSDEADLDEFLKGLE